MWSDCDPPTFKRRCEKPKKLQGATSQQQTTLQPEMEGVVETGDAEKQNWYRYHCLNWMEGQRNGERWFEFGSGSIVSDLSEMVWACSSTLVLAFLELRWNMLACFCYDTLGGLYLGVFGFVQWLFEINRCPFRLWFGSGKKHISRPGNSGENRTRGSWKGEEGRRRTKILSFFERNILLCEFSRIFFQKTSLTITWLECTSPSTLILIIGQSWNLNHLPCHFHPRLLPHVGLEGQRRRNGYRPLESRCQGREGWEAVGMTSLQFFLKNVLFNGKVVN